MRLGQNDKGRRSSSARPSSWYGPMRRFLREQILRYAASSNRRRRWSATLPYSKTSAASKLEMRRMSAGKYFLKCLALAAVTTKLRYDRSQYYVILFACARSAHYQVDCLYVFNPIRTGMSASTEYRARCGNSVTRQSRST